MDFVAEDVFKLVLAIVVGGLIGAEREFHDKSAGFRTLIFICVGSTLFTMFSHRFSAEGDPARVAAQIVSGVGFLGAGVILRDRGRIVGLTTAAMIWLAAALGMGIGSGSYQATLIGTGLILVVMWIFPFIERRINHFRTNESYEIVCRYMPGRYEELLRFAAELKLTVLSTKYGRINEDLHISIVLRGSPKRQVVFIDRLMNDSGIHEIRH